MDDDPEGVLAKYSRGIIASTNENLPWSYLDRFCFVSELGNLNFTIKYPSDLGIQSLLLYYDTSDQWDAVYDTNLTCEQRVARLDPENNQQIRLTPIGDEFWDPTTRCVFEEHDALQWTVCRGNRRFVSRRARWWYLAVSNCEPGSQRGNSSMNFINSNSNSSSSSNYSDIEMGYGIYADYTLEMTNGDPNDLFFYHFSADEFYILPVNVTFLLLETVLLLMSMAVSCALKSRNLLHQTFKLYQFSIVLECVSLFFLSFAYYLYALNGFGINQLKQMGMFMRGFQTSLFLLLLLLIAKGYTITRGRLSASSICKLVSFIFSYMVVYIAMFFYAQKMFDSAKVTYVSESMPGYCLAGLRIIGWLSYAFSSITTANKYPGKRGFYSVMGALMTLWFLMGPISILIANFVMDKWVREEVVNLVECCVTFYGFFVFMVLTWPSAANRNFPFHVRTTQIGDSYPGDFPQNNYEARYTKNEENGDPTTRNEHIHLSMDNNPRGIASNREDLDLTPRE
ncbi:unnamed protein product, partial [Mesorhabditis spiculigera]